MSSVDIGGTDAAATRYHKAWKRQEPRCTYVCGVGWYFTPLNPGRVSVSRSITPDHALITPFSGREHTRWHPLSIESNFSVITWHSFCMGGDHFDVL